MKKRCIPGFLLLIALVFVVWLTPVQAVELPGLDATLHGFVDTRYGQRLQKDLYQRDDSLAEARIQLGLNRMGDLTTLQLRADVYYDDLVNQDDVELEEGRGWLDLREANLLVSPHELVDLKAGRQILTWGTGDLLFINDLFPKDWQSFFVGRDEEYLKAPSDALLLSFFPENVNIDFVWTPRFDSDRYIRGERLSYWNPMLGRTAGRDAVINPTIPEDWVDDGEYALRLSKNLAGYELALYGYFGFWKSPLGFDPLSARPIFPELSVYGASGRGNLGPGLFNIEAGYYDSRQDRDGDDPNIPNSEGRFLAGYEQEVVRNITLAAQYYLEVLQEYDQYRLALPPSQTARDEYRQLLTLRLTWMLHNQNMTVSFFGYYSPTDEDSYLRPSIQYKLNDDWMLTVGGNLFAGKKEDTFFGQFEDNTNIYAGIRYSF